MKMINIISLLLVVTSANAQTVKFNEIWQQVNSNSVAQQAANLQAESLKESVSRASRHWLPRLYLDVKAYNTNDPAQSFMGLLEQRKVTSTDFSPDLLNHPDQENYVRGAIGVDVPLFEGGMKSSQAAMYRYSYNAQKAMASQVQLEQYAAVSSSYGTIMVLKNQIDKLNTISVEMTKLLKSYQIGQKSNPVGYSGLLGMKSLSNRISGLIEQYKSEQSAYYRTLKELGVKNENWIPESLNSVQFVEKYLTSQDTNGMSNKTKSNIENAKAADEMSGMEKARFIPRLGAFAESYLFNGKRDTANGYMAGLYLQWNLFDPADFGRLTESKLKARAAEKQTQALVQQENSEKAMAEEMDKALRTNLKLLNDSDNLMNEQMRVATTLFRNGSISALQLVEILNRRTDLIVQQNDLEAGLIKTASNKITKYNFQIPTEVGNEATK